MKHTNYLKVYVDLPDDSVGHIYKVLITEQNDVDLIGSVINEEA